MDKDTSFYIDTLGCKLNQAESEEMSRNFMQAGVRIASSMEEADLYILNTCSVTREAERKARQFLRRARNLNRKAKVYAAGCYTRRNPGELEDIGEVIILHNNGQAGEIITNCYSQSGEQFTILNELGLLKTRSMLKIQEGCNYRCTYCVVPSVKGREHSIPSNQIVDAVKTRVKEGYKEVVLTGTRIGSYNNGGQALKELISMILYETSIERIRLSSLQPQEIDGDLLALWSDKRLCPHFHIPLQSGCDRILQKMGRRYCTSDYIKCVGDLREQIPEASITTDIIVGFPEEGDTEFDESLALCREIGFTKIHVFPFSPRVGTPASSRGYQVDIKVKKDRSGRMLGLSTFLGKSHLENHADMTCSVLWEKEVNKGFWTGLAENYIRIYCYSNANLRNSITPVKIKGLCRDGLSSEII